LLHPPKLQKSNNAGKTGTDQPFTISTQIIPVSSKKKRAHRRIAR
jgi:hypothetical protein